MSEQVTVLGGKYRLLQRLGSGGHAEVFLAEQREPERKVALKVIRRAASLPDVDARFKREALIHASIDHPSVVKMLDFESGEREGAVVVMEYVDGTPLHARLKEGRLSVPDALKVLVQLAQGLGAIHHKGVVHRDLKAENVMLTRDADGPRARILDFGLARLFDADSLAGDGRSFISSHGLVAGTPAYVSPEALRGLPPNPRSDVYSFGVLAHFVLAGALPFRGPEVADYVQQHFATPPPPLPDDVPPALAALVRRCLSKEPGERPGDGSVLAELLQTVSLEPATRPAPKKNGRGRVAGLSALVLVVAAAPVLALERPWEPLGQARWLIRLGRAEQGLAGLPAGEVAARVLLLDAAGRTEEVRALVKEHCLTLATALEPAERKRVGVSMATCR